MGKCLAPALLAVLVAACSSGSTQPVATATPVVAPSQSITGTVQFRQIGVSTRDGVCSGIGQLEDVRAGLDVVVRNEGGTIVGRGVLEGVNAAPQGATFPLGVERPGTGIGGNGLTCTLWFGVAVKPAEFYEVAVGTRTKRTLSKADLEAAGWRLDLTIK